MKRNFYNFHVKSKLLPPSVDLANFFCPLVCCTVWFIQHNLGEKCLCETSLITRPRQNFIMQIFVEIDTTFAFTFAFLLLQLLNDSDANVGRETLVAHTIRIYHGKAAVWQKSLHGHKRQLVKHKFFSCQGINGERPNKLHDMRRLSSLTSFDESLNECLSNKYRLHGLLLCRSGERSSTVQQRMMCTKFCSRSCIMLLHTSAWFLIRLLSSLPLGVFPSFCLSPAQSCPQRTVITQVNAHPFFCVKFCDFVHIEMQN